MPVTDSFVEFVVEQLDALGPITPKRMFGGVGLYAGDLFFALVAGDVLYIKADAATVGTLKSAGARPFEPYPDRTRRRRSTRYYSVPAAILEDHDTLVTCAKQSVAIARAQHPVPRAHRSRRRTSRSKESR